MKVVIVEWLDAHTADNDEIKSSDIDEELHYGFKTISAGFLIKSDRDGVSLATDHQPAQHNHDHDHWRGAHFIPRCMVISEKEFDANRGRRR